MGNQVHEPQLRGKPQEGRRRQDSQGADCG